jgi:hypothetical protein
MRHSAQNIATSHADTRLYALSRIEECSFTGNYKSIASLYDLSTCSALGNLSQYLECTVAIHHRRPRIGSHTLTLTLAFCYRNIGLLSTFDV